MILRELFARLGLDVDAQSFAKGQLAVEALKLGLNKMVEFAQDAVDQIQRVAESGKELKESAQATGLNVKALQELRSAAAKTGVDAESLNGAFFRLAGKMRDSPGEFKDADDAVMKLADRFVGMPDGLKKTG